MQFLMFVMTDPTGEDNNDDVEVWVNEMDASGARILGDRLAPVSQAKQVRVRGGELVLTDGPFAETREIIAGFDLLEAPDMDAAIEIARKHPMAQAGALLLRALDPWMG
ncbi:MAG: YCII-related protein [Glaciihabitans sp.]|jgi:hypothetical protein|nr:YCII-related protein [Glaciihabitans sp.]MCU1535511.1 YCII-related protein [Glaciihabitans sp.]MDQ1556365.1 hypothetical protein [Actinomycetota bacterium]